MSRRSAPAGAPVRYGEDREWHPAESARSAPVKNRRGSVRPPTLSPVGFCIVGCLLASRARCSTPSGGFATASSSFLGEVREGAPKGEARPTRGPPPAHLIARRQRP